MIARLFALSGFLFVLSIPAVFVAGQLKKPWRNWLTWYELVIIWWCVLSWFCGLFFGIWFILE